MNKIITKFRTYQKIDAGQLIEWLSKNSEGIEVTKSENNNLYTVTSTYIGRIISDEVFEIDSNMPSIIMAAKNFAQEIT